MIIRKPSVAPCSRASSPRQRQHLAEHCRCARAGVVRARRRAAFGMTRSAPAPRDGCRGRRARPRPRRPSAPGSRRATILQKRQFGVVPAHRRSPPRVRPARRLLVDAGDALAPAQLGQHVAGPQAVVREQRPGSETTGRPSRATMCSRSPSLAASTRLGRLLADLLQDRVLAVGEQPRDVGRLRVAAALRASITAAMRSSVSARLLSFISRRRSRRILQHRIGRSPSARPRAGGRSSSRARCGRRCRPPARP